MVNISEKKRKQRNKGLGFRILLPHLLILFGSFPEENKAWS